MEEKQGGRMRAETDGGQKAMSAEQLAAALARITESEEERGRYARRQFYMSAVTMICSLLMLGVILAAYLAVIPKADAAFEDLEILMDDMGEVSGQLAKVDLKGLVEDIDKMTVTSEQGIGEALEKINEINIDELNQAIKGLSDVVSPFAKLMNRFR